MGILFVLKDFLGILNDLNRLLQFRLLTYKGIMMGVERANRKLRWQFLGENGVQNVAFKTLLTKLGGAGGEAAFREKLNLYPDGFLAMYENSEVPIRITKKGFDEVVAAGKALAESATHQLNTRFEKLDLLESFSVFDPHLCPTDDDLMQEYGNLDMIALVNHFGCQHEGIAPSIEREETLEEWTHVKHAMLEVRRDMASEI